MQPQTPTSNILSKIVYGFFLAVLVIVAGGLALYVFFVSPPSSFKNGSVFIIESGQGIGSVANELKVDNVVRSPFLFRSLVIFFGGERTTSAGLYVFDQPENVFTVAYRISHGNYGYAAVKITIPEGVTASAIADLVHDKFPSINRQDFFQTILPSEGYLFPETYFFPPQAPASMIADRLKYQFEKNIESLKDDILASGYSKEEIITVASILEEEVRSDADRKKVADIIWRRLATGIPLQVDSTVAYVIGRPASQLSSNDLKKPSPYNTYLNKGLPPTPISNPGKESMLAALHPTANKYLYFLSDKDGITHFAVTYSEHVKNIKKYLK